MKKDHKQVDLSKLPPVFVADTQKHAQRVVCCFCLSFGVFCCTPYRWHRIASRRFLPISLLINWCDHIRISQLLDWFCPDHFVSRLILQPSFVHNLVWVYSLIRLFIFIFVPHSSRLSTNFWRWKTFFSLWNSTRKAKSRFIQSAEVPTPASLSSHNHFVIRRNIWKVFKRKWWAPVSSPKATSPINSKEKKSASTSMWPTVNSGTTKFIFPKFLQLLAAVKLPMTSCHLRTNQMKKSQSSAESSISSTIKATLIAWTFWENLNTKGCVWPDRIRANHCWRGSQNEHSSRKTGGWTNKKLLISLSTIRRSLKVSS